jgi:hypothetical protein
MQLDMLVKHRFLPCNLKPIPDSSPDFSPLRIHLLGYILSTSPITGQRGIGFQPVVVMG